MGKAQRAKDQVEREDWMVGDLTNMEALRGGDLPEGGGATSQVKGRKRRGGVGKQPQAQRSGATEGLGATGSTGLLPTRGKAKRCHDVTLPPGWAAVGAEPPEGGRRGGWEAGVAGRGQQTRTVLGNLDF